jgi:hypothetical protein
MRLLEDWGAHFRSPHKKPQGLEWGSGTGCRQSQPEPTWPASLAEKERDYLKKKKKKKSREDTWYNLKMGWTPWRTIAAGEWEIAQCYKYFLLFQGTQIQVPEPMLTVSVTPVSENLVLAFGLSKGTCMYVMYIYIYTHWGPYMYT